MTLPSFATLNVARSGASQDRVQLFFMEERHSILVGLSDGCGGMAGGESAAELFVNMLAAFRVQLLTTTTPEPSEMWVSWLIEVDYAISRQRDAGECTGIVLEVRSGEVVGASVGDSEAWLIDDFDYEVISRHQARKPRLGSGDAQPVGFRCPRKNSVLLVGSDGLFSYVRREQILSIARNYRAEEAVERLCLAARLKSGGLCDDFSAALIRI